MYSGIPDRIWSPFSTQNWYKKTIQSVDAFLNILTFDIFVQKYDSYRNCRKKWVLHFKYCTRAAYSIIFYNVFSDNVNNWYESILLIISFLFFFVGKVLVANEKNLRNKLYLTDNINIFVENVTASSLGYRYD